MSAPERLFAWWECDNDYRAINQWDDEPSRNLDDVYDHAEYIRADTVFEMIRQAVQAEREACAVIAVTRKGHGWDSAPAVHPYDKGYLAACDAIATFIRARGGA